LRVLHAYKIYKPDVEGGVPEVISSLTRDDPDGLESSILVARSQGLARNYSIDNVPVTASSSFGTLFSMPIAPLYPPTLAWRSHRVELIIHHTPFPLTDLSAVGLASSVAFVVHWHAEIMSRNFLKSMLAPAIHHALRRADKIIVSHPVMIDRSEFLTAYREKCIAVPYGLDTAYWSTLTELQQLIAKRLRERFPRLVVAVGRLVDYKGYSVLLHALKGLDAQLVIIGDGPLLSELKALSHELGVAQSVVFAGRLDRDEMKQYLHAARVMVLASVTPAEAFGLVQIEAMAAGRPVVNTSLPTAVPFIVRHEREGLTVAPGDADAMRSALRRLLDDEALAARLGSAGQLRANSEYNQELFRTRNFAIYKEALEHRRSLLANRA
jgi:glycosyltransferase involved in cell wall biosynthesis